MADIIIPWSGNHASIPAGWTRYTALDGKFPKASGAEAAEATGGATTHTHTSTAHSHTLIAHTHSYTTGNSDGGTGSSASSNSLSNKSHTHSGTSGTSSGGTTATTAVTYAAYSNNPPYHELIFIKAALNSAPADGIIMWDQTSAPTNTNFKVTDGNLSTIDLNNKYLKSSTTGGNSGGTGGSTSNTHSITHTHTTNTHTQGNSTSGGSSGVNGETNNGGGLNAKDHTHSVSFSTGTQPINSFATDLTPSETVEPAYSMLMAYQNKAVSAQDIPLNGIAMTIETTLPVGWSLCDGTGATPNLTDKYVKITTSSGSINSTGGANTHTHASEAHTHTSTGGHTHTTTTGTFSTPRYTNVGSGSQDVAQDHAHSSTTTGSTSATYAAGNTAADSSANQPEYVIVKYIQRTALASTGAFFALLI